MSQAADTAVLIVGAGPTGLTLACELARRGVDFRLINAAEGPFVGSRGKGLQPRSLEVFDDLGIVNHVLDAGRFHLPFRFYGENGSYRDHDIHEGREPRPDRPYASSLIIPQWRTEGLLRDQLGALGGQVAFSTALLGLTQDDEGITATVSHGEKTETIRAAWLVGCDGGRSQTRRLLGVSFLGETIEAHRMLVGDVKATGLDRDHWHAWRSESGFLALAPLPGTDVYQFQASIDPNDSGETSLAHFQDIVNARSGRDDIHLSDPTWMSLWRANVRMVDRYRVGRAFIGGDAAHVHSPAGGQGMNTGIQDAYNLGWKLAAVINGAATTLLDSYEEERLPIAAWLLGVSSKLYNVMAETRGFPAQRDEETLQLGLNYRDCRLSQEERSAPGTLRAGDRAPDATGLATPTGPCRMFDLLRGTHVTLLAFGTGWEDVQAQAEIRFGRSVKSVSIGANETSSVIDHQGHATRGYDAHGNALFVVRPDGHLGLVTDQPSAEPVLAYLDQVIGGP